MAIPTFAFAATGDVLNYNDMAVVWGPNPVGRWGSGDSDNNGVIVVANSMYNAAIVTCGYDVLDTRLTHDVKAKLSNASTGGNFYTFAQTFECFQGQDGYNYPSWNRSATGVVDTIASLYGSSNVWWSVYDSYLLQSAKEDLEAVLNGEDLGGGGSGSGGVIASDVVLSPCAHSITNQNGTSSVAYTIGRTKYYLYSNISDNQLAQDVTLHFNDAQLNVINQYANDYQIIIFSDDIETIAYTNAYNRTFHLYFVPKGMRYETHTVNVYKHSELVNTIGYFTLTPVTINGYKYASISCMRISPNLDYSSTQSIYVKDSSITDEFTQKVFFLNDKKDTEIPTPPTNWPTDPTPTPKEPPEVPEPPTTTPPTQPTPPTSPTPPTYQPQPVYVTTTFTADLQGILDAMDEHCQHIQNALYQQSKNLYEDFTTYMSDKYADLKLLLDGNFGYIGETIDDGLEDLKDYLWDLFKWLKNNMEFSFTAPEYDDSSVLSWLKKIYSKMGTGIRSKPVDPVVDPVGAWNWLEQLIQGILGALSNAVGGLTGTVGELFNGIKEKFPFSIPWDLAAILALFDAAPVTPQAEIDYTIFESGPVSIPVHWDINLHYLDDTMGTVRAMEDIVFCFYLLMKTDWLSSVFDGIGEYLGGRYRAARS